MISKKIVYKDTINDLVDISLSIKINNLDMVIKNSDIQSGFIHDELNENSTKAGIMFPFIAKCKSNNIKFKVKADINYGEFISKDLIKPTTIKNNKQLYIFNIYAIKKIESTDLGIRLLKFCSDDGKNQFINALFSFIINSFKDFTDNKITPMLNPVSPDISKKLEFRSNDFPPPLVTPNDLPFNDSLNKACPMPIEEYCGDTICTTPIYKVEEIIKK